MDNFARPLTVPNTEAQYIRLLNLSTILERVHNCSMTCLSPLTGYTIKRVSEIRGKTVQN